MKRRTFLNRTGLCAAALPFSTLCSKGAIAKPHIIMYISDDHGIDFVGCYGNTDIQTPTIDRLAGEGVLFNKMFAASPWRTITRISQRWTKGLQRC